MTGDNKSINKNNNVGEIDFISLLQGSDNRFPLEEKLGLSYSAPFCNTLKTFNPFQPSVVAFPIETSHLICSTN